MIDHGASYARLIYRTSPNKNLVVARLEILRSVINGNHPEIDGRDAMYFVDDMTYSVITTISHNFKKYSTLFNLEAHDKAYYIDQLDQIRLKVGDNIREADDFFCTSHRIFTQYTIGREFLKIGKEFLTDIEHIMKYSVDDIAENWQEIFK